MNILLNNLHAWNLRFLQYFNGKLGQISDQLLKSSRKLEINNEDGSFIFNVMIQLLFGEELLLNEMKITVHITKAIKPWFLREFQTAHPAWIFFNYL